MEKEEENLSARNPRYARIRGSTWRLQILPRQHRRSRAVVRTATGVSPRFAGQGGVITAVGGANLENEKSKNENSLTLSTS